MNTGAIANKLNVEGFKGEKIITYLGVLISLSTLLLLWKQWMANKTHMELQAELAKEQLKKIKKENGNK
jgi:hypothetical protein